MDAQTTQVIPVSYIDVKELRAENTADGVLFAARVSLSLNLDVDEMTPSLSPGRRSVLPSKARMDRSRDCGRVSSVPIHCSCYRQGLTL